MRLETFAVLSDEGIRSRSDAKWAGDRFGLAFIDDQHVDMAKQLGLHALLMINDYDEGRVLAERSPAGGVVSLAELADALLLIEQRSGLRSTARMPLKPFELFEPG